MDSTTLSAPACEWRVLATSVAGTRHENTGHVCQDANLWRRLPNGFLVVAVADGAGSASLAEIGSYSAVSSAVEWITQHAVEFPPPTENDDKWKSFLTEALQAALTGVEKEATTRQVLPRDLATTLILVVAGNSLVAAAQIGDGAALVRNEVNELFALTHPASGEYINETTFLVSTNAILNAQINVWRGRVSGIAAFSDGLQMLALHMADNTPHAPFFSPLFRFVGEIKDTEGAECQLRTFLRSPRITQRTDDDLTLLVATLPS